MGKVLLFCLLSFPLLAQTQWEITKIDSVFTMDSVSWKPAVFGGISSIEKLPNNTYLLVSDRQAPSTQAEQQISWSYRYKEGKISIEKPFFGIKNVESVRFHGPSSQYWFSYENDEETGVGYIDFNSKVNTVRRYSMLSSPYTTLNRGIEGLAAGKDLWYAFEAGLDSTMVVRWKDFNPRKETWYKYPLDRKACLAPELPAGSRLGNGISEILDIPGEPDKLLVLERCFDGKISPVYLYEVDFSSPTPTKQRVFTWDGSTEFQGKNIRPDNFEGMSWDKNNETLVLVVDDNHNTRYQRTLIATLEKKK
jgi:hypothetical protein